MAVVELGGPHLGFLRFGQAVEEVMIEAALLGRQFRFLVVQTVVGKDLQTALLKQFVRVVEPGSVRRLQEPHHHPAAVLARALPLSRGPTGRICN